MNMDQVGYVCLGTCKAFITEEQYVNGLTACGTQGCTNKGHTFVKGGKCHVCGETYPEGQEHKHE